MLKQRILLVEDDANLGFVIKDNFEQENFEVNLCTDGEQALKIFKEENFDLCILDVMLPKMDGYELAKEIRVLNDQIPLLFLTAKSMKEDRLHGFNIGADDYITKPFSIEELILRCKVFIKRSMANDTKTSRLISIGQYSFDVKNQLLIHPTEQKKLTLRESLLLQLLTERTSEIIKREYILKEVWGTDDYFAGRSMDVFISRLRKYLSKDSNIEIINYHSVGFKLSIY